MLIELVNVQPICVVCDYAGALVLFYDTKNKEEKISRYSRYEMCVWLQSLVFIDLFELCHILTMLPLLHHLSITCITFQSRPCMSLVFCRPIKRGDYEGLQA